MLNDYQVMVVRRALAQAKDQEAEIKRLAKGMQVKESEIQQLLAQMPRSEFEAPIPQKSENKRAGRTWWTTKQLEQLHQLRAEKKGPTEIAHIMGLKTHQVQSKLHSEKKSRSAAKPSTPVQAGDDLPTGPPVPPPEPEPAARESESPSAEESQLKPSAPAPVSISEAARQLTEPFRKISALFSTGPEQAEADFPGADDFPGPSETHPLILASELLSLIKYLEYSYPPVSMGLLQANQAAGWATCRFTAAGEDYIISLRREESKS